MFKRSIHLILSLLLATPLLLSQGVSAQEMDRDAIEQAVSGLRLREIGPALMGGRIADIKVHPTDPTTWYVAVGSGGLWKTTNAGITWTPIFDDQPSYSIGTVEIDPNSPDVIWVGTGENVSGRHVAWGDGVYRSRDGGRTWENVGLGESQHIGKILVDPRNSDVVFVAAEGPLWNAGGDRGLYKTTDGGETWALVLEIDGNTGVTDAEFDPTNPDVIYAAAYQRRRHIWSLLAGGPESGIYKSMDGGETWRKMSRGLPGGDMGKIGLAVTPADPNLVYATIEAAADERGFYRSQDKGESWAKRNSYTSGGTGPHYYQEIEASPQDPGVVYQMDVFFHVTRDGGANFDYLGTGREKHSDNHALWIDPKNGKHLIAGTDAGLYESFDDGTTWRHFPNMPVSQFYKVALDNSEPFYNILGGAQDLGTLWGPSRTMNTEGIRNRDWYVPMGADGYAVEFDPTDPNIFYLETQQGNMSRHDKRSEESIDIKPQPAVGDPPERWNWDTPIVVSPHNSNRVYVGSQRVWRSDDRGNSWTPISTDLTTNRNRYELELMDRVWSVNALYDNGAMSKYATITTITESPLQEGAILAGTDDGNVRVTLDGGATWNATRGLPGVPPLSFINDAEASLHDANTFFVVADAHKTGDFSPYVFESTDGGQSWNSMSGDLPAGTIVWAIQQDHVDPDLLFLGTEYGIYFTPNRGTNWFMLGAGAPTIAFRDIKIHRRDEDLVGATFGRGFYVLDDFTSLREISAGAMAGGSTVFPVRDSWSYVPNEPMQARGKPTLGSDDYTAENPPFGAVFTYYVADVPQTAREARRDSERELREARADVPFPGWEALAAEAIEGSPRMLLLVREGSGAPVRWIRGSASEGVHRASWDLRRPTPEPISFPSSGGFSPPWASDPVGPIVAPGTYSVELTLISSAGVQSLGTPQEFEVNAVPTAPPGTDFNAVAAFQLEASELMRRINGAGEELGEANERLRYMRAAMLQAPRADAELHSLMNMLGERLAALQTRLWGDRTRGRLNETSVPSISGRAGNAIWGYWGTRQMPTETMRRSLEIATSDFALFREELSSAIDSAIPALEEALEAAGAPWTPGRRIP